MRAVVRQIGFFLGSPTLTIWLVGLFVLYYLTMAVWIGEAFGRYVTHLSSSTVFQAFFLLFLVNVTLRVFRSVVNLRRRWLLLAIRLPLLIGLVLVLASFFLSLNVRQQQKSRPVGEGDPIDLPWDREPFRIVKVEPAIGKRALRTDESKIFDYEPGITIVGKDGRPREIGAFPPRRAGKSFLHVLMFGLGPGVELYKGKDMLWRGYVALRLLPYGRADTFVLPDQPYTFSLSVMPNDVLRKGRETARSYDLERPRYLVEIVKGDQIIRKEETDGSISFGRDLKLSFFPPSDWVIIEAVRDPFLPWFGASLLLFGAGVLLYPFSLLVDRGLPGSGRAQR